MGIIKNVQQLAIAILLLLAGGLAHPVDASCTASIIASEPDELLLSLIPPRDEEWLAHGKGCYPADETGICEWTTTLKQDVPVGTDRRLLVYNADHAGSGAWNAVRLYGCIGEVPRLLLSKEYLYGAEIEVSSAQDLVITSGDWQLKDANCCPSKEKREHFAWNKSKNRYVLKSKSVFPTEHRK